MVEIIFIGTGGGRFNLVRQLRRTGGFRIHGKNAQIHVDPGPGASLGCRLERINLQKTDAIIATHAHIDHVCELPVIIEAMAGFSGFFGKHVPKGTLIGSKNAIEGTPEYERPVSKYHLSKLENVIVP
ncbi:MAG TPA: MBL fold metallo-hydrolase, partial [Candidatus Micrarchaeota archaeon]|nr:MBL fold metallo-hydrolase [Candidatus Micrarchaeota archaeon]